MECHKRLDHVAIAIPPGLPPGIDAISSINTDFILIRDQTSDRDGKLVNFEINPRLNSDLSLVVQHQHIDTLYYLFKIF